MANPVPEFSRSQVDKAGDILKNPGAIDDKILWAFRVLYNWRSCHVYPMNTFQATLRGKIARLKIRDSNVVQRLKRRVSIVDKLRRYEKMKLSRMQDIGGLRAVVSNLKEVELLRKNYENSKFAHKYIKTTDYILNPKLSGYRSIHIIYKYKSRTNPVYDGLFIELQIRSKLQHVWATAVETMGTFLEQALKSSEGETEWLDFFSLTGSAFAHLEKCAPVPGYENLSQPETYRKVIAEAKRLNIKEQLQAYTAVTNHVTNNKSVFKRVIANKSAEIYYLLVLDIKKGEVRVAAYAHNDLESANEDYAKVEKEISDRAPMQAVLVSSGHIKALQEAYPNYFLDTREFIQTLGTISRKIK